MLRNWSIPAIHFIVQEDQTLAVLDGQQRLHALNEFVGGRLTVDSFPPFDDAISQYKGLLFKELPAEMQRRVLNFKVPSYRLYDYKADEPYELFFRLNLPTGLTQAEKRNSLMGKSRTQVKQLTQHAVDHGWQKNLVGFENARLAYDDVVARLCIYIDQKSLGTPLTTTRMESQFRAQSGFDEATLKIARIAIDDVSEALSLAIIDIRPNKASILSWLLVSARQHIDSSLRLDMREIISYVEYHRRSSTRQGRHSELLRQYLNVFDDRASLRVTDVMSVILRDVCAWRIAGLLGITAGNSPKLGHLTSLTQGAENHIRSFESELISAIEADRFWREF